MLRREGTFVKGIQHKPGLEGDIQVILKRTVEIQLWFRLVAQGESLCLELVNITRHLHRGAGLDLPVVPFFSH